MTEATTLPDLILYGRDGCSLCDETRGTLLALLDERRRAGATVPHLRERDIDLDPELQLAFRTTIPVVELGSRRLELATSPGRLRTWLADMLDA